MRLSSSLPIVPLPSTSAHLNASRMSVKRPLMAAEASRMAAARVFSSSESWGRRDSSAAALIVPASSREKAFTHSAYEISPLAFVSHDCQSRSSFSSPICSPSSSSTRASSGLLTVPDPSTSAHLNASRILVKRSLMPAAAHARTMQKHAEQTTAHRTQPGSEPLV